MNERNDFPKPVDHPAFDQFVATIAALRSPSGCPWDKAQTHASIASNMIEEAYEAVDAIEAGDVEHMREELGDVLLQVVLQSQIAADEGEFTIDDVCRDVDAKIVHRHPHVFGDAQAASAGEVLAQWEKIKVADQSASEDGARTGLLDSIPKSLPALIEAQKISRKAVAAGFEWESLDAIYAQVEEELAELRAAWEASPKNADGTLRRPENDGEFTAEDAEAVRALELECGDVLFAVVNLARRMGLSAEACLRATDQKFRKRWAYMEAAAAEEGRGIETLDVDEQEALWDRSKRFTP